MYIKVESGFITVSDFAIKHRLMFDSVASGHRQIPIFLPYTLGEKLDLLLVDNFFFDSFRWIQATPKAAYENILGEREARRNGREVQQTRFFE